MSDAERGWRLAKAIAAEMDPGFKGEVVVRPKGQGAYEVTVRPEGEEKRVYDVNIWSDFLSPEDD